MRAMSPVKSSVEVTLSPPGQVPIPPVLVLGIVEVDKGWIVLESPADAWREVELPPELYLHQAREVDLDSDDEVVDFVRKYGPPRHPRRYRLQDLPLTFTRHREPADDPFAHLPAMLAERRRFDHERRRRDPDGWRQLFGDVHVDEVRLYLTWIRNMTSLWRIVSGQRTVDQVRPEWLPCYLPAPYSREVALHNLVEALNPALAWHASRVELVEHRTARPRAWTTYRVMTMQLRNHIAENARYSTCANERCNRLFVRQDSPLSYLYKRLEHVRYCSWKCGDAQKQRDYRRYKVKERQLVAEIVATVAEGSDDQRLTWTADRSRVTIEIERLDLGGAYKRAVRDRRRRFGEKLRPAMSSAGWRAVSYGVANTFERAPTPPAVEP